MANNILMAAYLSLLIYNFVDGGTKKVQQEQEEASSQQQENYQGAVFIYPPGIRSERDIPVCSGWGAAKPNNARFKDFADEGQMQRDMSHINTGDYGFSQNSNRTGNDILVEREGPRGEDKGIIWESACNVIHKRYFYPTIVERLCRCPDRTSCPWQWSHPPNYPNSVHNTSQKGSRDPYTIMLSNRSQAKFCTEVTSVIPRCNAFNKERKKSESNNNVDMHSELHSPSTTRKSFVPKSANLVKTLWKVGSGDEIPRVTVNCYCPPLWHHWVYVGQTEPKPFGNGTVQTNYYYKCERLQRCKKHERCGNIRTDLHFSFYSCSCQTKHLCLPKVYPPETADDVEEDINEVLFRGQISPLFCTDDIIIY